MLTRLLLTLTNLFFPPLAVLLLTGPYTDTLISCLLFICGVIPSHIHGFYISCTYFHRKGKLKRGRYPGGAKAGIFDERVWRGGASRERVEELRVLEEQREQGGRKRGGKRRKRGRMDDGFVGNAAGGFGGDGYGYGYEGRGGGYRGDEASYRGHGRSEMSEGYR